MDVDVLPAASEAAVSEIQILERKVADFVNNLSTSKQNPQEFKFKVPEIPKMRKKDFLGQEEINNNNEEIKLDYESICIDENKVLKTIKEKIIIPIYNCNAKAEESNTLINQEISVKDIQLESTIDSKKVVDEFFKYGLKRLGSDHESGRLYAAKLEFIITQQNNNEQSKKIREKMYKHIRRKTAEILKQKNKYSCLFVGNLASYNLISEKTLRKCFYTLILNKTKQDMKCLLKLAKGYSRSWMKEMPDLGENFVKIIFERIYDEKLQKKMERYICEIFLQIKIEQLPVELKKKFFDLSKNCQIIQPRCPVTIKKMAVLQYSTAINLTES